MPAILDALKKHNAPGAFFVVAPYIEENPDLVRRMAAEGHTCLLYTSDLTREEMQAYRGDDAGVPSKPSPYRGRTPQENLELFRRMRAGEFADGEKTLRAKIDLASPNMNMRDPAIYRIKHVSHHRQGDKWLSLIHI